MEEQTKDLRQSLNLVDNFDDEILQNEEDCNASFGSPLHAQNQIDNCIEEVDENQEPSFLNDDLNITNNAEAVPNHLEKRSTTRKSHNELDEEDEMFTRRTKAILTSIAVKLRATEENHKKIFFEDLFTRGSTRRTAAQKFYALLELHKLQAIELEQKIPFGPIAIMAGTRLDEKLKAP